MSAVLIRHGHFPPERQEFLTLLTRQLPGDSRLHALVAGAYPGGELLLVFDWLSQRVRFVVFAKTFREHYLRLHAEVIGERLRELALQQVHHAASAESVYLGDPDLVELLRRGLSSSRGW